MDLDELLQEAAEVSAADVASFHAKVRLAAQAVRLGAVRALAEHLVGRYTTQTLNRLALLEPLLDQRPDLVSPDANLGIVWLAFKLASDGDVDLHRFAALLDEATEYEYSLAEAKAAWGVADSDDGSPGAIDLGSGEVRDGAIITESQPPAGRFRRVKVWPE